MQCSDEVFNSLRTSDLPQRSYDPHPEKGAQCGAMKVSAKEIEGTAVGHSRQCPQNRQLKAKR
jgi:hypothetical protein